MNTLVNLTESTDHVIFEMGGVKRYVKIVGTNDDPWFCGKDVCTILGYVGLKQALQNHVKSKYKKSLIHFGVGSEIIPNTIGQNNLNDLTYHTGKALYINEAGLFSLIMHSKAPMADQFQDLVYEDILPSIRKHGNFALNTQVAQLSLKNEEQEKQLEEQAERLVRAERKALRISKFMNRVEVKEKRDEWIYIATTRQYAASRVFKIGSTERLMKRIGQYNCGRPQADLFYYVWVKPCYKCKDLDSHIQKLLFSFKDKDKSEVYVGVKFTDLVDILDFIINNYDQSQEYVYNFIRTRLEKSADEDDGEPPKPLNMKSITYHFGNHTETVDMSQASETEVKDEIMIIINRLKEDREEFEFNRKELVDELMKKYQGDHKSIWNTVKKVVSWKNSRSKVSMRDGNEVVKCNIVY